MENKSFYAVTSNFMEREIKWANFILTFDYVDINILLKK